MRKKAIIIGAGPAGLTAAYELLKRTDIIPVILEKSGDIGGISKTINYKGNRMDMGPHRFFSKSDRVMDWWLMMMPLENNTEKEIKISYQNKSRDINADDDAIKQKDPDNVMLVIQRLTRIYFLRKFFAYPIKLSLDTLRTLGLVTTIKILFSFLWVRFFPIKHEKSLADFIINKFGKQLYFLFFKDYTEKVWGVPCHEISAEWGAQRIKGVSLSKAISQGIKSLANKKKGNDINQKGTETSLIEQFLYPKHGPGSLWEEVARQVQAMGGKIILNQDVQRIYTDEQQVVAVNTINNLNGQAGAFEGNYFFSTMPVQELIAGMDGAVPAEVKEVAAGLQYRDFINVGILLKQLSAPVKGTSNYETLTLKDNWIYIQERDVKVGRLMIYNNWGGGMINDPNTTWIGMEYFCNKADAFWALSNESIQRIAIEELEKMELARVDDVLDITVQRMEKTYPAYFGTYNQFNKIRAYTDQFENLFLVGRNGMHKYNNADHSMLTAMVAVDNICKGVTSKANIWEINTEQDYHEEKKAETISEKETVPAAVVAEPSFLDFIWRNKWNRGYAFFAMIAFLLQFIIFKFQYPYANYMPDSYSYLEAAALNVDVNMWPVAYSKFLRIFSGFSHSDTLLVGFQYFFMALSGLVFLYTLLYFFKSGKAVKFILIAFFIFNPVALYISNYISADALFIGLSLLWLTQLIWIIYRPRPYQVFVQALLLLAVFTVRYNAIYYPLIATLAFLLSRQNWRVKTAGIALGSALIFCSVLFTSNKMHEVMGKRQFSAFGGWQLANNALYMYEQIPPQERQPVPARFAKLEGMVRQHIDTLGKVEFKKENSESGFFYLWSHKSPLIQYMTNDWKKDTATPYFNKWASESPLYMDYALSLIRNYPVAFAQNFIAPNAIKYAVPPLEFLGTYNMGSDSVRMLAKQWFNYKSQKIKKSNSSATKINSILYYPVFIALVNVLLLICVAGIMLFGGFKGMDKMISKTLLLLLTLWMLNIGFSITAAPIVLRYQVFPGLVSFSLAVLCAESVFKLSMKKENKTKSQLT